MPEFLRKLISPKPPVEARSVPHGKSGITGKIEVSHGKGFKIVREDILQKGLARNKHKEAA